MAGFNTQTPSVRTLAEAGCPQGGLFLPILPSQSNGTGGNASKLFPTGAHYVLRSAGQRAGATESRAGNPIGQGTRPKYPEQQAHAQSTAGYTMGWSHQDVCPTPPCFSVPEVKAASVSTRGGPESGLDSYTHNTFSTVATSNFPSFSRTNGSVGDQFSVRHLPQWRLPEGMSTSQGKIPVEEFGPFPSSRLFQGKVPQQEFCPSPMSNVFPGKLPTEEFYPRSVATTHWPVLGDEIKN